jgi:hypothetical protein
MTVWFFWLIELCIKHMVTQALMLNSCSGCRETENQSHKSLIMRPSEVMLTFCFSDQCQNSEVGPQVSLHHEARSNGPCDLVTSSTQLQTACCLDLGAFWDPRQEFETRDPCPATIQKL